MHRVLRPPRALARGLSCPETVDLGTAAPERPSRWQERFANWLFLALSPRMARVSQVDPPRQMAPFERLRIPRSGKAGHLDATWYLAQAEPRGAVLLVHPWIKWGQAYFHRRGRIRDLVAAGYHVLTFDLGGIGGSSKTRPDFFDRDLEDAFRELERRAGDLPLHLWGVSCGGYWAHPLLSGVARVEGAFFEDVARHLIEWSGRMAPYGWPCYLFFRRFLPDAYRFMDLRRHAPYLKARRVAYVSGCEDRGVRAGETRELARLVDGSYRLIVDADHLESIKKAGKDVIGLALETFDLAERASRSRIRAA